MTKQVPATTSQKTDLAEVSTIFENIENGYESVTVDDLLVPRLNILQALSPQLKKSDAAYIKGAEAGDICDVGTGEVFKDGIKFLPVMYRKEFLEWAPRNTGGGLVNVHTDASILEQTTRDDKNRPIMPSGNLISETAQFYGLNLSANNRRCFLPMSSTQLKKARKFITLAMSEKLKRSDGSEYTAPLFYRSYDLSTAEEQNNEGTWYGWTIARAESVVEMGDYPANLVEECLAFRDVLNSRKVSGDMSQGETM